MNDNSDRVGLFLIGGLLLGTTLMAIFHGLPHWDWTAERWLGNKPVLDYIFNFGATAVAAVVALTGLRTFRLNNESGLGSRFQNGIELLASDSNAANTGGVFLMEQVATQRPNDFERPFINTIKAYISERSLPMLDRAAGRSSVPTDAPWPNTPRGIGTATSRLMKYDRKIVDKKIVIFGPYFHNTIFEDETLQNFELRSGVFGHITFLNCQLVNVTIRGRIRIDFVFDGCSFSACEIQRMSKRHDFGSGKVILRNSSSSLDLRVDGSLVAGDGSH
jgi:hypothetical protein